MTEPHAGTDVGNYATNATVRGASVSLKGKTLVSRAEEAIAFVVFTRVNGRPGRDGIGCVLVEQGTPGLVLSGKFHTMGGEYLAEVRFEDCQLSAENLLLGEGGFKQLISAFNTQRCLNPSISLGLAEGAFDEALRYARERSAFGRAIGEFQGMRWKLADMYNEIEAGRGLLYRACASADPFPTRCWPPWPRSIATRCRSASPARPSRCSAATVSPTNTWCRGSIAAPATAASAAGPPRRCAT